MNFPMYVDFRDKGSDPQAGGTVRADSAEERDELTAYFKAADLKVTWTDKKGNIL